MKLAFSTKGWHGLTFSDFLRYAEELRFSGVEIHNISGAAFAENGGVFAPAELPVTARRLHDRQLSIPCLDSRCDLGEVTCEGASEEMRRMLAIARALGVENVRVRIGAESEPADASALIARVEETLSRLLPMAEQAGVCLLIETVGIFADSARLRGLLESFASDSLGALWDLHHSVRSGGETPETTIRNLGAYVRHVHVKDSVVRGGVCSYCLPGEGDLPLGELMTALRSINYNGFIALEMDPAWIEELGDPDIVFPHFAAVMSKYDDPSRMRAPLYPNHDGTGQMVWKKDTLIEQTFSRVLDRMVEAFPDQYCFKYTTLDYTRTYAEFRDDVDTCARALVSVGVKPGSHVAVWATNVPQWYITFWATVKIGAVLVTMNTDYKIREAEYLLRQSDTHTLVTISGGKDCDYSAVLRELCPEIDSAEPGEPLHCRRLPFLRNVITVGFSMKGCLTWDEFIDRAPRVPIDEIRRLAARVSIHDVCNMQYTSGTTGFPKGVMLTHYNVVNNGKCIGDRLDLSTADRMMIQVPMFHCFGMVLSMTASMTHGATMCPLPYFNAKTALSCITQERITCFNGVPTMFIGMFNHPDYRKTDFSYIRTGIMAGSGCPPELMRRAAREDEMHMTGIVSVYGQTEAAPGCTMSAWDDPLDLRCDTVGYAFPHVECKVIDPATGEEVPDGTNGEFCSRGYNTMKGYYKMPAETSETVDAEGWLHSGDLAMRLPDGTFRITGRLKDMIIRGGENIYPREIEEFIYTHPKVKDVQVIGVPDVQYGEAVLAAVILKDGETMTEQEMTDYVRSHMARIKVPKYVRFTEDFPKNAAGKVLKYKMREQMAEELGLK